MTRKKEHYPYEPDPENPRNTGRFGGPYNEPGAESGEGTPYIEGGGRRADQSGGPFLDPGADPGPE